MRHYVVMDSSFIVATADKTDPFYKDALYVFQQILIKKDKVRIIIPPLALYELTVTLHRKGFTSKKVEKIVSELLRLKNVIFLSITEASAFKHCSRLLKHKNQTKALRTADFMIASIGLDFEAQILTFDRKLLDKIKIFYPSIYYCSRVGGFKDETGNFLIDLNQLVK